MKEDVKQKEQELEAERKRQVELEKSLKEEEERKKRLLLRRKKELLMKQEKELREKILKNWKTVEEKKQEQMRESLRTKISGKNVLKSTVVMKRWLGEVLAERKDEEDPLDKLDYIIDTKLTAGLNDYIEDSDWMICKENKKTHMRHVTRKPVFGVCNQVGLKLTCSATETN